MKTLSKGMIKSRGSLLSFILKSQRLKTLGHILGNPRVNLKSFKSFYVVRAQEMEIE